MSIHGQQTTAPTGETKMATCTEETMNKILRDAEFAAAKAAAEYVEPTEEEKAEDWMPYSRETEIRLVVAAAFWKAVAEAKAEIGG